MPLPRDPGARVTEAGSPVGSGPGARHHELRATAEHRAALLEAGLRAWWERGGTWLRAGGAALLLAVGLPLYGAPWPLTAAVAVLVPGAVLGLARLRFGRTMRRRLAQVWEDGSVHGTAFDDAGFVSRGPLGAVEYRLPVIAGVRRRGEVVEVRLRPRGAVLVVAELFPAEEERRLAARADGPVS